MYTEVFLLHIYYDEKVYTHTHTSCVMKRPADKLE